MRITLNKGWGLALLRALRRRGAAQHVLGNRIGLEPPDSSPQKHWSQPQLDSLVQSLGLTSPGKRPLEVAVPTEARRIRAANVKNTIYSGGLPEGSFVDTGDGVCIPCPELLFVEMAMCMDIPQLVMLGYELCGNFARNPARPRNGDVVMHTPPVTSVERIRGFISACSYVRGTREARTWIECCADNAWSPTESVMATVMSLPIGCFGYELGPLELNARVNLPDRIKQIARTDSRVPDILLAGTKVGVNYDGALHLDLDSIVTAAMALERDPGSGALARDLDRTVAGVRAKAVDDIRRNRELTACGYTVYPVVKEDMYEAGVLDAVMAEVIEAVERGKSLEEPRDYSRQKRMLQNPFAARGRRQLVLELMPSQYAELVGRMRNREPSGAVTEVVVGI